MWLSFSKHNFQHINEKNFCLVLQFLPIQTLPIQFRLPIQCNFYTSIYLVSVILPDLPVYCNFYLSIYPCIVIVTCPFTWPLFVCVHLLVPSISLFILPVHLPIHCSFYLSIYQSIVIFTYPFIHPLSFPPCPFTHPSIVIFPLSI